MKSLEIALSFDAEAVAKALGLLDEQGKVVEGKTDDVCKMIVALDAISFFNRAHSKESIEEAAEKIKKIGVLSESVTYATAHSFLIRKQGEQSRVRGAGLPGEASCLSNPAPAEAAL